MPEVLPSWRFAPSPCRPRPGLHPSDVSALRIQSRETAPSAKRLTNQRAFERADLVDQRHAAISHPPGERVIDTKKPRQAVGGHAHQSDRLGTLPGIASQY